jgi:hypothetical protein
MSIPDNLPAGWASGRLDDGTPFFYHEHDARHVVFSVPEAAAPPAPTTPKKPQRKGDKTKKARKSAQKNTGTAGVPTSTTVRSPSSRPTDVAEKAKAVLLCHFQKYSPEQANEERVAEIITQFQLARNFRRDWTEIMYTTLMHENGEDPRDVWADVQATLATSEAQEEDLLLLQSAAERMHPLVEEHLTEK